MANEFWSKVKAAPEVAIVGDYDTDGICSVYIMGKSIQEVCPGKRIVMRIPRRFSEGYGINDKIRLELENEKHLAKGSAVITVDNGIAASEVLEQFEKDGYVVLMTDHHELRPGCSIPKVTFAVDPAVPELSEGFNFKKWCGAAVAFKLCEHFISEKLAKELEVFAGVATVTDCMDLKGGNWGLVRKAINAFRKGKAPTSLSAMLSEMKQDPLFANEDSFGFYIGPCFNAFGRLADDGASKVLKYLFAPSAQGVRELVGVNEERRKIRDAEFEVVDKIINEEGLIGESPIWVKAPNLHEGIVGILAGKVAEKYHVPAIVVTDSKTPGVLKGSARSYGGIDIFKYLSDMGELFEKMGGHPCAAGFSITEDNFKKARKHHLNVTDEASKEENEWKINAKDIPFVENFLKNYRPFGEGNPAPVFELDIDITGKDDVFIGTPAPIYDEDGNPVLDETGSPVLGEKPHLCIRGRSDNGEAFKITHFSHNVDGQRGPDKCRLLGKISGSAYKGIETPTFNADEVIEEEIY